MCSRVCARARARVRACVRACVHACMRACICPQPPARQWQTINLSPKPSVSWAGHHWPLAEPTLPLPYQPIPPRMTITCRNFIIHNPFLQSCINTISCSIIGLYAYNTCCIICIICRTIHAAHIGVQHSVTGLIINRLWSNYAGRQVASSWACNDGSQVACLIAWLPTCLHNSVPARHIIIIGIFLRVLHPALTVWFRPARFTQRPAQFLLHPALFPT